MIVEVCLLAAALGVQQRPDTVVMRALVRADDSAALVAAVKHRPAEARELLAAYLTEAAGSPARADPILAQGRRLAHAYAAAWDDSFPVTQIDRFSRMTQRQRATKRAADSVRLAGNAASTREGMTAAIAIWRRALRLAASIRDTAGMAAATGNLGAGFYQESTLDSAEAYLTRAVALAGAVGDKRTALNALGVLSLVALDRGELRRADEALRRALPMRAAIGDVRGVAADHASLGIIASELGDLRGARGHHENALRIATEHGFDDAAATALLNLGNLSTVSGEYADADARYGEALAMFRALGQAGDVAFTQHNRGLLALRRGDYPRARDQLRSALAIVTEAGTAEDVMALRIDLASVDAAMGDLQSAVDNLRAAGHLLDEVERDDLAGALALARADLAVLMNMFAVADHQYGLAQAAYHRNGDAAREADAQHGHAMLLAERKQYDRALRMLDAARRVQLAIGDPRPAAHTDLVAAHVHRRAGDVAAARVSIGRALGTFRDLSDAVAEAAALVELGDLELEAGTPLAAESQFSRALERLAGRTAPEIRWQAHFGLGRALRARGAGVAAITQLRAATAEVERTARSLPLAERRAAYLNDKWQAFAELALAERARGSLAAAFETTERMRARQLTHLLARGPAFIAPMSDTALLSRERDLRFRIGDLTQRLAAEAGALRTLRGPGLSATESAVTREALAQAYDRYEQLLLEMRDAGDGAGHVAAPAPAPAAWSDVAARLGRDQALLSYLITDSTTMVFVITRDTMRLVDLGVPRSALASLVDFVRGTIMRRPDDGSARPWAAPLARLHAQLIAPLEGEGLLSGVRQLLIVPHAELHYLPFGALIRRSANGGEEFLVERFDIGYAPSATTWLQLRQRAAPAGDGVLALAPHPEQLPGSRAEVSALRALYDDDATILVGSAATETAFRAAVDRYAVVHLATYGVLNRHNPLFSFIELHDGNGNDGRLEVHEVSVGGLRMNARLLILSACQTALGSGAISDVPAGDDWVGLVRAFLGAGAHNVVATLWAVEDRSTAEIMERLHRRLRAGDSDIAALSQAQREALRNPATAGPFYWAGFVLTGGP
jgi:CHAT domain-containing protein